MVLQALLYRIREGCTWRALSIFAPYTTIYTRWKSWCDSGLWQRIFKHVCKCAHGVLWAIDSTCIKVHKHGLGAPKALGDQKVGRTRGGQNTKVHALVDSKACPVAIILSAGNRHDILFAGDLVSGETARTILADKAYDCDGFRDLLAGLGHQACIPPKDNRKDPEPFHRGHYKKRHRVENFFQRIKEYRAIATRYEKRADRFEALVLVVAILCW